jgi:hypothetical protein
VIFGIWPGVAAADLVSLEPLDCPAEDTARTLDAVRQLQGTAREFYVRAYRHFGQGFRPRGTAVNVPARPGLYAGEGRMIDLVACYQSPVPDPAGFVRGHLPSPPLPHGHRRGRGSRGHAHPRHRDRLAHRRPADRERPAVYSGLVTSGLGLV